MSSTKTILIFTDWYIPGSKAGGPIQSVFNLANLLSRHFIVKVVCRDRDLNSSTCYERIKQNEWIEISSQHFVYYASPENTKISLIKELIKENKNNVIYINGLYSLYFSILPAFFANYFSVKSVFIAVRGMLHASALSVKKNKKLIFLALTKGYGLYRNAILLSTNDLETKEIEQTLGEVKVRCTPNIPINPNAIVPVIKNFKGDNARLRVLFLGRIAREKNPITLLKALQTIGFNVEVTFCGAGLDQNYQQLFNKELDLLPAHVYCQFINDLPHYHIRSLFENHDVMVLPSLGENFGHAIFESFAFGVPVIIGNNTPWKDIELVQAGFEIEPLNEKSLQEKLSFFNDLETDNYNVWSKGAKDLASKYFNDQNFEQVYLKLFNE